MTRITDVRGDLQVESSGSLFKSPLAQIRGHIVAAPLDLVEHMPHHGHRPINHPTRQFTPARGLA